jgi:hypothetical protein
VISDNSKKSAKFGFSSGGHHPQMRCGACDRSMPNAGRRLRTVRGRKVYVCVDCQRLKGPPAG